MLNEKTFRESYEEKDLKTFNRVLTYDKYSNKEKVKIFDILKFFPGNHYYKDISNIADFFEYLEMLDHSRFNLFANRLLSKINNIQNDEEIYELSGKMRTLTSIPRTFTVGLDRYFKMINDVLGKDDKQVKFSSAKEELLSEMFNEMSLTYDLDRLDFIFDTINNREVKISRCDNNIVNHAFNIINDKDILYLLGKDYYREAIEMSLEGIQAYILDNIIHNEELDFENKRKRAIIDYYYEIFPKYLPPYISCSEKTIKEYLNLPLYNVVLSPKFLQMDPETYKNKLDIIAKTKFPFTAASVLKDERIDDDKEKLILDLLKSGKDATDRMHEPKFDSKWILANCATSDLLLKQSDEEYERILRIVNNYINSYTNAHSNDVCRWDQIEKAESILKILISDVYKDNWDLAFYMIELINKSELEADEIRLFTDVITNENIEYFTLEEVNKIYEIFNERKHNIYLLEGIFTSGIIPYLDDKSKLFDLAVNEDYDKVRKVLLNFDDRTTFHNNKATMLEGVDENLLSQLSIKKPEKHNPKRLLKNNN